ncbi:STAS domain-containing protein [Peptoniphilus stercorisuis]|uniref:Anti-sigma factor antagonist n=1 Tax=Peptoniphilus stercorisuis TaxID=1436965 RepID=A0ABS4KCQ4_9FIRM|nr:STAS domain-containing protein [Peptoniphilus stercorisuis]MBP2025558.1 anti-sigma B factor antagonist [Peptoniphilus stercorisuis]
MAFQIEYENKDEIIIYPKGELDVFTTPELKKEVLDIYNKDKKDIVIDGTGLEYVDSTGLGALMYILNEIKKDEHIIYIQNMKPTIKKLFTITKLDQIFKMRGED